MSLNLKLRVRSGGASEEIPLLQTPTEVTMTIAVPAIYGKEPGWTKYLEWMGSRPWADKHTEEIAGITRIVGYLRAQGEEAAAKEMEETCLGKSSKDAIRDSMEKQIQEFADSQGVRVESLTWEWWAS